MVNREVLVLIDGGHMMDSKGTIERLMRTNEIMRKLMDTSGELVVVWWEMVGGLMANWQGKDQELVDNYWETIGNLRNTIGELVED